MIPSIVPQDMRSKAEYKLFFKIQQELSNSWTVLHSLGLGNHRFKPWAETDFVLIGPHGVFCIEVKGGRVARCDGEWSFQDGQERIHVKREGPFEQAGGASAALFKFLQERIPDIKTSVVGFGVATPDLIFQIDGPDIIKEVVYDERDCQISFSKYVERIAAFWIGRVQGSRSNAPLNPKVCERILEQLRPDFDLEPTLRCQMRNVCDELVRLTNEQYLVVDGLAMNPRAMISGGAGTGKSLLAMREARRISAEGGRVLLCCFNRQLAQHLRVCLRDCPNVTVENLHGLMAGIVARAGLNGRLPPAEPSDLFNVYYPELCLEALLDSEEDRFDALIIDEGQDLMKLAYFDVFDVLLRGGTKAGKWRVFYDPKQDIFKGLDSRAIGAFEAAMPAKFQLFKNCRNTLPIATTTSLFVGMLCPETLSVNGPEVRTQWYSNPQQQIRQVSNHLNYLLGAGVAPHEIVILSKRKLAFSVLALGLKNVTVGVRDLTQGVAGYEDKRSVRFSTVAGFKGLESEAIIYADIDDLGAEESRELLYVGTSRARTLLAVFLSEDVRETYSAAALRYGELLTQKSGIKATSNA
jgi:hypothetical protein